MKYKREIAENMIAEIELNGYQYIFGEKEWEKLKKDLMFSADNGMLSTDFWDNVKYIAEEIADFTRR